MRKTWIVFVVAIAAILYLTMESAARATDGSFDVIKLRDVSLEYKRFVHPGRDPLFTQQLPHKEELNLHMDTDVLVYGFWNNTVHAMTDDAQYRVVGWKFQFGLHVTPYLDVQYSHFSKHLLDREGLPGGFPVEDSVGFHLYIWRNKERPQSLMRN
jgi:hypothetical protein